MLNRGALYNSMLTEEESLSVQLGIPLSDGIVTGSRVYVESNTVYDSDVGLPLSMGVYKVESIDDDYACVMCECSGDTFRLSLQAIEAYFEDGLVSIYVDSINEDGKPGRSGLPDGYIKDLRGTNMPAYNYFTSKLFHKGYLQKFRDGSGNTTVKYRKRAFPKYASGNPNPEYATNMRRARRRRWREKNA